MFLLDMTCDEVDDANLDVRYVAGSLAPADAEAFEEHYFGCERCWALVQQGLALRAAAIDGVSSSASGVDVPAAKAPPDAPRVVPLAGGRFESRRSYGRPAWRAGALAAAALLVAVSIARFVPRARQDAADTERGAQLSLPVTASRPSADSLVASWPRVAGAVRYRVRMFSASGALLAEGQSGDTTAVQLASRLRKANDQRTPRGPARLFWNVEALDVRGTVIAKSPLTPVPAEGQ
jgi:hypothetical protein